MGDVLSSRWSGVEQGEAVCGVGRGEGGEGSLVEQVHLGDTVMLGDREQHGEGCAGARDPGDAREDRGFGAEQTAEQGTPGKVNGEGAGNAVQLGGQRFSSSDDEERVGQATTLCGAGGAVRCLSHGGGVGVDTDHEQVGAGCGGLEHEAAVTGTKIDDGGGVA